MGGIFVLKSSLRFSFWAPYWEWGKGQFTTIAQLISLPLSLNRFLSHTFIVSCIIALHIAFAVAQIASSPLSLFAQVYCPYGWRVGGYYRSIKLLQLPPFNPNLPASSSKSRQSTTLLKYKKRSNNTNNNNSKNKPPATPIQPQASATNSGK